ncbi:MAG: penicillin-binding protein 1C, partial [bacterium]
CAFERFERLKQGFSTPGRRLGGQERRWHEYPVVGIAARKRRAGAFLQGSRFWIFKNLTILCLLFTLPMELASTSMILSKENRSRLWLPVLACLPFVLFLLANWRFPLPVEKLHPAPSTVVVDRGGKILRVFLAPDEMWRMPVAVEEISPALKQAVLAYEDRYFYWHVGVNPFAIVRAAIANLRAGRVVQGGSTLTMQVARMMEPKPRTIANKLVEAFRALQLEWRFSKEEILTLYFNMAPYGGNIVGVGAASYLYFDKHPQQLGLGEAALLAAIPNAPNLYRPDLNPAEAKKARARILRLLVAKNKITTSQGEEALTVPLPQKRYALPFRIPHLSSALVRTHPKTGRLQTTIDEKVQRLTESILQTRLKPLKARGISNGAVVVIENQTQGVLALVGSSDFFDLRNAGQVNGATAPRSPGSTLKPFIYALGLEHGLISPQGLLNDVPVEYSGYRPVNYDKLYHGAVTAEQALIRSLNVPAVNLYARLGENGIYSFLKAAGISTLPMPREYYGLSLILGGCEVTLLELTNLYAGLANGGRFRPFRVLASQPAESGRRLLRPGTCYIVTDILSKLRRPELPAVWESSVDIPKVAWKTGTSYGHRDAWSIGYTPDYTVGVWVGNFDGKGVPALVGADIAAPILFALLEALENAPDSRWFVQPSEVEHRQVCAVSGMPVSKFCVATKDELFLPGISPNQPCSIHQLVLIDQETGQRLCSHCRIGRKYREKIVERWPAEIATWLASNGYPIERIPTHYSKCSKVVAGNGPVINSPLPDSQFKIRPFVDLGYQKILLQASVSNQTRSIYWFLDGRLIHSGDPKQKVYLTPRRGAHKLLCVDDEGRSSAVSFEIQ